MVRLKISGYGGLALAVPIVMWQIWRFIVPGLHRRERRYAVGFVLGSVVLFVAGLRRGLVHRREGARLPARDRRTGVRPLIDANKYLTLVMLMIAAFGFAFEFPLLLIFLLLVGAVNTAQLRHVRRFAAVGITTFAAIITPSQDPFSLLFMAVPLYIFYEASILIGRLMKR